MNDTCETVRESINDPFADIQTFPKATAIIDSHNDRIAQEAMCSSLKRELAAKDAEIARLKAALKPVVECRVIGLKIEYGGELPGIEILINCHNCVREAQRIVGAWDDKNYFDNGESHN